MIISKTIPETTEDHVIRRVTFNVEEKRCWCEVEVGGANPEVIPVEVNLEPALTAATSTQLATIKSFFKWILAKGFDVAEATIPDTVFEPNN